MYNAASLQEKWAPLLNCEGLDSIKDTHRRAVTAILLENQERALREERGFLQETPTMSGGTGGFGGGTYGTAAAAGPVAGFDPVLISLIRRSMPQLIAYDICGVQPMTGPTGLIFAMRTNYGTNRSGTEGFFNEPDSRFSGQDDGFDIAASDYTAQASVGIATTAAQTGSNPAVLNDASAGTYNVGQGMPTSNSEALGDAAGNMFNEMNFSIEKVTVAAKSRALKAEYSLELAQDLKAIHGLDAEAELANILSTEILAEINREVVRTIYQIAEPGAQANVATAGIFDLDVDSNGRWSVEKFKGLLFQLERDANAIAQRTRRGKGNTIICSADVASALTMAGVLDYTPALNSMSMILAIPLLVLLTASIRSISTHIRQTFLHSSIMLSVSKDLILMMLVYSIALMFLFKWFAPLVRIHSNLRLALKPATAWLQTHTQKVQEPTVKVLVALRLTPTVITEEYKSKILCEFYSHIYWGSRKRSLFFI